MHLVTQVIATIAFGSLSAATSAGHHESADPLKAAASTGQIVVVYHWPCADTAKGLSLLTSLIAYEKSASPVAYTAVPAMHADGAVVSIDVHPSAESMDNAVAWQGADEQWQAGFAEMEAVCGSADDLTTHVLTVQ